MNNRFYKKLLLLLSLILLFCTFSGVAYAEQIYQYSDSWYTTGGPSIDKLVWHILDEDGALIKNAWICDLESTMNETPWYLIDEDGDMVVHPIVKDGQGYYYAINDSVHDGSYGHMLHGDGEYYGVKLSFNKEHNGHYGSITNPEGIKSLAGKYGVKTLNGPTTTKYLTTGAKTETQTEAKAETKSSSTKSSNRRTSGSKKNALLESEGDIWNYIFDVGFDEQPAQPEEEQEEEEQEKAPELLKFTALEAGATITLEYLSGSAEYSTDGGNTWTACYNTIFDTWETITLSNIGDSVCFRGNNVKTGEIPNLSNFSMTKKIAASGDVTSLTNGVGGIATLDDYCYWAMFKGCTTLTTAPSLPSTQLAEGCYWAMFEGCTALTTPPSLPATTLAGSCYYSMFFGCGSLTISATSGTEFFTCPDTIPSDAVTQMFMGTGGGVVTPVPGKYYYQ